MHCASLMRTIFASLARAHERVSVQNVRNFPQTKLDSRINAPFLLNEHCDPHFLFPNFNEYNILNNWGKYQQKSMATFSAKKINSTEGDITGPTAHVQIMFTLKDKKMQSISKHFFLGRRWINNQRKWWYNALHWKITELICCTLRLPKVS